VVRETLDAAGANVVVTDVASTKRPLASLVDPRFVPGHPVAGGATGGPARAAADLFDAATWFLTPTDSSSAESVELVERLRASLDDLEQALQAGDRERVEATVATAAAARERLESFAYRTEPGQLNRIRVRVPDQPGVLARITQILGAAQINLEDFELRHVSPEYGGVLVILVAGADNAARARELLRREGFAAA